MNGALRIPDNAEAVVLVGGALEVASYAVTEYRRYRAREGLPALDALDALAAVLSPIGHADIVGEREAHPEEAVMSVKETATLLGISPRHVRRLAPRLGGRLIAGNWWLAAQAVHEHLEGRNTTP